MFLASVGFGSSLFSAESFSPNYLTSDWSRWVVHTFPSGKYPLSIRRAAYTSKSVNSLRVSGTLGQIIPHSSSREAMTDERRVPHPLRVFQRVWIKHRLERRYGLGHLDFITCYSSRSRPTTPQSLHLAPHATSC